MVKQAMRRIYEAIPFKRQLFGLVRRGVRLPHSVYQHLHFEGPFLVKIDNTHHFIMNAYGDALENEVFWGGFGGTWEQASLRIWVDLCRAADGAIVDVGANTGIYSLAAAAITPAARVIAFEPIARVAARLAVNAELNGFPICIVEAALSDRTGMATIFDTTNDHNYSASLEQPLENTISYPVKVTTLDQFMSTGAIERPIQLVKIDVETHEPAVLRGMCQMLERERPAVMIEILGDRIGGEVAELISDLHYRWFHIDENSGLVETKQLRPIGGRNWNHLLCTDQQFASARLDRFLAPAKDQ